MISWSSVSLSVPLCTSPLSLTPFLYPPYRRDEERSEETRDEGTIGVTRNRRDGKRVESAQRRNDTADGGCNECCPWPGVVSCHVIRRPISYPLPYAFHLSFSSLFVRSTSLVARSFRSFTPYVRSRLSILSRSEVERAKGERTERRER